MSSKISEFISEIEQWSEDGFHTSGYDDKIGMKLLTYVDHLQDCKHCQEKFLKFTKSISLQDNDEFTGDVLEKLFLGIDQFDLYRASNILNSLLICSNFTKDLLCPECKSPVKDLDYEITDIPQRVTFKEYFCSNGDCENEEYHITFPLIKLESKPIFKQSKFLSLKNFIGVNK